MSAVLTLCVALAVLVLLLFVGAVAIGLLIWVCCRKPASVPFGGMDR